MASTLPQPSRPSTNPPTTALPPLPVTRSKKSMLAHSETSKAPSSTLKPSKLRTPSASPRPSALAMPQPSNTSSGVAAPGSPSVGLAPGSPDKTLRRAVSIAAFPQPPKAGNRPSVNSSTSSLSQLSTKSRSPDQSKPLTSSSSLRLKKARTSTSSGNTFKGPNSSRTPSLLNSSGDGKSIPNAPNARNSEGHFSIPSPPQSRSSSAQGSYSTSATTYDEVDDSGRRGREESDAISGNGKRSSEGKEAKGNVIVSVRVRPDTSGGENSKSDGEWMVDGRRSLVSHRGKESGDYFYDNVFTAHDNNARVYDSCAKRLVRRVMEGYHGTVFAYGMTGTGKTFSMQGTATSPGVIPLAITDIFSYIRETPHREFLLRVSYLEIYNEKIHDLLSPPPSGTGPGAPQQEEIKLREDSKRGVYASPLKEEIVQSPTQLLRVIARGDHARRTGSTQFNARSSRSHAVVQIVVESRERVPAGNSSQEKRTAMAPGGVRVSTLSLIDLAGSERAAENKERRTEGAHINKSLLTLGTVIARLSGDKDKNGQPTDRDGKHLPYRDSKLTRLLQPALSGNSLVSILCTLQIGSGASAASAQSHTGETLNTLKFAARAKNNIVSHAKRAEEALGSTGGDAGSRVLLERYRMEIQSLRSQLEGQARVQNEKEEMWEQKMLEKEAENRHEEQMLEMQLARTALKERIEHLNRLILCSKSTGVNSNGNISTFTRISGLSASGIESSIRSIRSSASQSTLGANGSALNRSGSMLSMRSQGALPSTQASNSHFINNEYEDDTMGEFADGMASLQMQVNALQADLTDKNRYISTLERRLLQARRSSHSRMSMGFSHLKGAAASIDDPEVMAILREKDMEISELRIQLDDKDRMVAALRSAARQRDFAQLTPDSIPQEIKQKSGHQSVESNSSSTKSGGAATEAISPVALLSPAKMGMTEREKGKARDKETEERERREKEKEKKRRSVDEMSRMLDEMIQDRVESGHLVKGTRGSVRVANGGGRRQSSSGSNTVPGMGAMVTALRGSVPDIQSA
ncbi:centromeric protein E, variant 3 [Blastomyces dermatitidis ATCC 26199]|nr:centromeric protein E [Blastomyces dermatitidis ATCC 26199]EQL38876.1 centromeric protein E, variant 1 [Blastomyces dermatitidis ATCC 26199]EQL38877.1 centromeric protein E, variant 2 [Blastomyces dermatitidis ATCC 26199]EQL38878.1 centromeric protein E, variant 3 [Blastomyces dermatitidis ATCC 26199]